MPMRRETLKALEHRRSEALIERKQSKMQTLGASNPYNNNKDKHRNTTKLTAGTVDAIFTGGGGGGSHDNNGFDASPQHSSNTDDDGNSSTTRTSHNPLRSSITFKDRDRLAMSSSDQHSSTTSKM